MQNIFFRCDSSLAIGSGHVIRCRNLARELTRLKYKIFFICKNYEGNLIHELKKEFEVLVLTYPDTKKDNISSIENSFYLDQNKDSIETLKLIKKLKVKNIDWIVLDHYGIDVNWEIKIIKEVEKIIIQKNRTKIFAIDDLANRKHFVDYFLNSSPLSNTEYKYEKLLNKESIKLLGLNYVLMSKEYELLHSKISLRKEIKNIFIFFGGVDPKNFTCKCLENLLGSKYKKNPIDIIIGTKFPYEKELIKMVKNHPNISIYRNQNSLAPFIAKADIALGSGGCVMWERASLYLPSIVIPIADNQKEPSIYMDRMGLIKYFENIEEFQKNIVFLDDYFNRINAAFRKSKLKWDGKGISRICKIFEQHN